MLRTGVVGVLLVLLTVTACTGGDEDDNESTSGPGFNIPEGVTLTSGGSALSVGQAASIVYRPAYADGTVITVRVSEITRGEPGQIRGLAGVPENAVPFYVRASVANAGPADLTSTDVPLRAAVGSRTKLEPIELSRSVKGCGPLKLDGATKAGDTATGCLLFAVPPDQAFETVQLATSDLNTPITWTP